MSRPKATRKFLVTKASGVRVPYDREKILAPLGRAGADGNLAREILERAEKEFHSGMTTRKIFSTVMKILEAEEKKTACLYDLKGGIRRLGPAGYNFETYVGEILHEYGHRVRYRQRVEGLCVNHEIDLILESGKSVRPTRELVECKYHRSAGTLVDLKEMMYTWARLQDINTCKKRKHPFAGITMASNTRASQDGRRFAICRGMKLLTWRYPPGRGLEDLINEKQLYPVTILRSTADLKIDPFSRAGLMLVKDFPGQDPRDLAGELGLSVKEVEDIIQEAELVLDQDD
jgi:hypothetical protein